MDLFREIPICKGLTELEGYIKKTNHEWLNG